MDESVSPFFLKNLNFMNINRLQLCLALAAGILVACQKSSDTTVDTPVQCKGIRASIDADTKVALSDETTGELTWISGDCIAVAGMVDSQLKCLKLSTQNTATVATFLPQPEDVSVFESLTAPFMGLYPFDSEAVFDIASGSVESGLVQNQIANEIESSGRILPLALVAKSQDRDNLNFYNVCSGIRFTVSSSDIVKVAFSGNDGEVLAGKYRAIVGNDNEISVEALGVEETVIVLESPEGLIPGNMYYITFLPTEFTSGFKFEFEYADGHKLTTSCDISKDVPRAIYGTIREADKQSSMDKIFGGKDLAVDGMTANCYIVTEPGKYKFPARKGNSLVIIPNADSAVTLWETYNSNDVISEGDLVTNLRVNNGYVFFTVPSTLAKGGNALIAVKSSAGQILWSWHIWVCPDAPAGQKLGDIEFMDRNLGATSITKAPECWGLMYQWGRKDPFPGACSTSNYSRVITTNYETQPVVAADDITGTVGYALSHPEYFIMAPDGSYDWIVGDHTQALWSAKKTIYDPCPAGWAIPSKDVWPVERDQVQVNPTSLGVTFISMPGSWFPAAGVLDFDGRMIRNGDYCYYQTYSASGEQFTAMRMIVSSTNADTQYRAAFAANKAYGNAVRCVKE